MLLIQDDHADIIERREYSDPCADRDLRFPSPEPHPLVKTLPLRKVAVKHSDLVPSEPSRKALDHLLSQCNFRHEHDCSPSKRKSMLDRLHIHFCLPARSDSL